MDDVLDLVCTEYLDSLSYGCWLVATGDHAAAHRQLACFVEDTDMDAVYALDDPEVFRLCTRPLNLERAADANAVKIVAAASAKTLREFSRKDVALDSYPEMCKTIGSTYMYMLCGFSFQKAIRNCDLSLLRVLIGVMKPDRNAVEWAVQLIATSRIPSLELFDFFDLDSIDRNLIVRHAHYGTKMVFDYHSARFQFGFNPDLNNMRSWARKGFVCMLDFAYSSGKIGLRELYAVFEDAPQDPGDNLDVLHWTVSKMAEYNPRVMTTIRETIVQSPEAVAYAIHETNIFRNFSTTTTMLQHATFSGDIATLRLLLDNKRRKALGAADRCKILREATVSTPEILQYILEQLGRCCANCGTALLHRVMRGGSNVQMFTLVAAAYECTVDEGTLQSALAAGARDIADYIITKIKPRWAVVKNAALRSITMRYGDRNVKWYLERTNWAFCTDLVTTLRDRGDFLYTLFLVCDRKFIPPQYCDAATVGDWTIFLDHFRRQERITAIKWFLEETEYGRSIAHSFYVPKSTRLISTKELFYLCRGDRSVIREGWSDALTFDFAQLNRDLLFG